MILNYFANNNPQCNSDLLVNNELGFGNFNVAVY